MAMSMHMLLDMSDASLHDTREVQYQREKVNLCTQPREGLEEHHWAAEHPITVQVIIPVIHSLSQETRRWIPEVRVPRRLAVTQTTRTPILTPSGAVDIRVISLTTAWRSEWGITRQMRAFTIVGPRAHHVTGLASAA